MFVDSGLDGQKQSGSNLWTSASGSSSMGQSGQTGQSAQTGATQNEVKIGAGQTQGNGQTSAKDAVKNQGSPTDPSPAQYYPSRDELMADLKKNPGKYNVPPGMPPAEFAQQYFNEFVAKLVGKQPYAMDDKGNPLPYDDKQSKQVWTPQEKEMLSKWGYNPEVPKGNIADDNSKSGLYGLRIDPAKGSNAPPIVAFRGTEPMAGPQDLQSDLGGKYVGQSQYEGNRQMIEQRLSRPGDKNVDVVGYSLGGALAQKYTADHAQQVGQLSTFQAPGIDKADADKFKAANADHHIDVNHFYNDADIVHRAGAEKLDGSFHQVKNPTWGLKDVLTLHPHLSSIICNSNADFEGAVGQQNIKTYAQDPQKDRPFAEGARRLLGPAASSFLGQAYQPLMNGVGEVGQGFGDAKKGVSELKQGGSDLLHHPLTALGELGHGIGDTAHGVHEGWDGLKTIKGGLSAGWNAAKTTAVQTGANLLHQGWDGAKTMATNAISNTGQAIKNGASNLAHSAENKIVGAGQSIANTASNVTHAAGNALSNTGHAISSGFGAAKKFLHL
jgi:pimeloyl-ACP methyl ester carboxylesterase